MFTNYDLLLTLCNAYVIMVFMTYERSVKHPNLSRRQRLMRRFVPAVVALAGVGVYTYSQIKNNDEENNRIVHTYYEDVETGSNLIQTAQKIEDKYGVDLDVAKIGIVASSDQSYEQNRPYDAGAGDKLVVYVNAAGKVVYVEVKTLAEQDDK